MAEFLRAWCWTELFQCGKLELLWVWCWIELFQCVQLELLRVWWRTDIFQCAAITCLQLPHKQFFNQSSITGEQIRTSNARCGPITIEGGCYPTEATTGVHEPSVSEFACCSISHWFTLGLDELSRGEPCAPLLTCEPCLGSSPW